MLWKCEGLDDEQLKTASAPPSNLTLLGLVRHMADVERGWLAAYVGADTTPALSARLGNLDPNCHASGVAEGRPRRQSGSRLHSGRKARATRR
jgi:hypothetical protein